MNIPKAIELAFAAVLRQYAELGKDVLVRAWQSLSDDPNWDANVDRQFPIVDCRCSPPQVDQTQSTMSVEVKLLCGTKGEDDKDHAIISAIYEAVSDLCDTLFSQFKNQQFGADEIKAFLASLNANLDPTVFQFGGFTYGMGHPPANIGGINMIGITMVVHYGRPDC